MSLPRPARVWRLYRRAWWAAVRECRYEDESRIRHTMRPWWRRLTIAERRAAWASLGEEDR